jgi:hypothetical protein
MAGDDGHWRMWWQWAARQGAGLTFSPGYIGYTYVRPTGQGATVHLIILMPDPNSTDREATIQAHRFCMN